MANETIDISELKTNNLIDLADCQTVESNAVFTPIHVTSLYKIETPWWLLSEQESEDFDDIVASREAKAEGTRIPYSQVRKELGLK